MFNFSTIFSSFFFFFNDTATTEIYTLSLHDALPIFIRKSLPRRSSAKFLEVAEVEGFAYQYHRGPGRLSGAVRDRKSTRLNSSHANISYAVFCLQKKKKNLLYIAPSQRQSTAY